MVRVSEKEQRFLVPTDPFRLRLSWQIKVFLKSIHCIILPTFRFPAPPDFIMWYKFSWVLSMQIDHLVSDAN